MKIQSLGSLADEIMKFLLGGEEKIEFLKVILESGGELWFFGSVEELEAEPDLSNEEKARCRKGFEHEGIRSLYYMWVRMGNENHPGFVAWRDRTRKEILGKAIEEWRRGNNSE